jgi:hypothetical protein
MAQARDSQNRIIARVLAVNSAQTVSTGATSAQGALWQSTTKMVKIIATANAWIAFGTNPTASAAGVNCVYLPAGSVIDFAVVQGQKAAVIQDSAAGKVCMVEQG